MRGSSLVLRWSVHLLYSIRWRIGRGFDMALGGVFPSFWSVWRDMVRQTSVL